MLKPGGGDGFVANTFQGLYFSDEENIFIDNLRARIDKLRSPYKRALAIAALSRACLKQRPRGIFTYVGYRYDDGRKDLQKSLKEHFLESVEAYVCFCRLLIILRCKMSSPWHFGNTTVRNPLRIRDGLVALETRFLSIFIIAVQVLHQLCYCAIAFCRDSKGNPPARIT